MKSILFIIPWTGFYINNREYNFVEEPQRAPEGIVGLASFLQSNGINVKVADMLQMLCSNMGDVNTTLEDLWGVCQSFRPDVIGFSFFTARFQYASQIFEFLDSKYNTSSQQRPLLIAGGVHPTLMPRITFDYIPFDALIIGEGEIPLLRLLNDEPITQIKGICLPNNSNYQKAELVSNLDDLPFPDWNLIDKNFYTQPSHQISNSVEHRVMPISFGRGCLYRCNFCAHNCFLHARHHSPQYFISKMEYVAQQCNVNTFIIQDSSIGNFRSSWEEVCHLLIEKGSPYQWWANLRANQLDEDFLQLLKEAGCIKLFFGFESGSQRILDKMNKRITVDQCRNAAMLCHKAEIPFYTSYIINYFGETEKDLELTEQLILETRPTSLAINRFSPIPGSIDYDNNILLIQPHIHDIQDWTSLGMLNIPLLFGDMSPERFEYWYTRLRSLKKYINSHEAVAPQQ